MTVSLPVLLTISSLVAAGSGLVVYHLVSRRLRRTHRTLLEEFKRNRKEEMARLLNTLSHLEGLCRTKIAPPTDSSACLLEALQDLQRPKNPVAVELPTFEQQLKLVASTLRQVVHAQGLNEMHAVVSFPKTGGSTLVATLARLFPCSSPESAGFHSHLLAPPSQSMNSFFQGILSFTPDTPWSVDDDFFPPAWDGKLSVGLAHRRLLAERCCLLLHTEGLAGVKRRKEASVPVINYILTVREPVAACVSMLFQFVSTWKRWESLSDERLLSYLCNLDSPALVPSSPGCPWPLSQQAWWKEQMEGVFGLDFLALEFDPQRGWQIYDFGALRFLVIRLESFKHLDLALSEFYDLPSQCVKVMSNNIGEHKDIHGDRYKQFLPRVKLPHKILDLAYSSKLAQHFYTA